MTAEFVMFTRKEFEDRFPGAAISDLSRGELVYDFPTMADHVVIRVYSSIDSRSNKSRGAGKDAIRTILFDKNGNRPLSKRMSRIYRSMSKTHPFDRLEDRIRSMRDRIGNGSPSTDVTAVDREVVVPRSVTKEDGRGLPTNAASNAKALPSSDIFKVEVGTEYQDAPDGFAFPFEKLNPIQSACHPMRDDDVNLVVATPTNSGKTQVAETIMLNSIMQGGRALYVAPLRALAQERIDSWKNPKHPFSKLNVAILTGDWTLTDDKLRELNQSHAVVLTPEMLSSRIRRVKAEKNLWLLWTKVVVLDEVHMIGMDDPQQGDGRGHRLEAALMTFTSEVPGARIISLSATVPNATEISKWIHKLNGKPTGVVESDFRAVPMDIDIQPTSWKHLGYQEGVHVLVQNVVREVQKYPTDRFLVFVHAKTVGRKVLKALEREGVGADFHNADKNKDERLQIEGLFRDKSSHLRALVSTSTTAWGCNLPARRVIVCGVLRGINEVHPYDVLQMAGRAGRFGLDTKGDSLIFVQDDVIRFWQQYLREPPPAKSGLAEDVPLAFHIIAEIERRSVRNADDLAKWYERSLARFQGKKIKPQEVLDALEECEAIKQTSTGYVVTGLGRVASWFYMSPFDLHDWHCNFDSLFTMERDAVDAEFAGALSNVSSKKEDYIAKNLQGMVDQWKQALPHDTDVSMWCPTRSTATFYLLAGARYQELGGVQREVVGDIDRTAQALCLLDRFHAEWNREQLFKLLALRVRYGVPWDVAALCAIRGIGGRRANQLWAVGVKSIEDFINMRGVCVSTIGQVIYDNALQSAEQLVGF